MKVTWETEDVRCGRVFGLPDAKERGIIGYDPRETDTHSKYLLISLSDGMVICSPTTRFLIAKHLNDGDYQPVELLEA
jgi:hypothetical protein